MLIKSYEMLLPHFNLRFKGIKLMQKMCNTECIDKNEITKISIM